MPKWFVELYVGQSILHIGEPFIRKDDQAVLSFLTTCLQDNSFRVEIVDNYHFLISTDFDIFDSENEVYQYAQSQLPILNGIMRIKFDRSVCSIKLGDVYHRDNNGCLTRTVMRSTLIGSSYPDEAYLKLTNTQGLSVSDMLLIARNNSLVAEALQYFAMSHDWFILLKIFEIIKNYAGKAENNGTLPKGSFDKWSQGRDFGKHPPGKSFDFTQTAHSYHWSGLRARHSSVESQKMAGVNPMTLNEAIEYIADIFIKWLQINP